MANTLAYYDPVKFTAVKCFIVIGAQLRLAVDLFIITSSNYFSSKMVYLTKKIQNFEHFLLPSDASSMFYQCAYLNGQGTKTFIK